MPSKSNPVEQSYNWDETLPMIYEGRWKKWQNSLTQLEQIKVPRCYTPSDFGEVAFRSLHVFEDASKDAIGYVAYLHSNNIYGDTHISFLIGDSRVSPKSASSISRLELCAAVGAVLAASFVKKELKLHLDESYFYSDSEVALAYIKNEQKRLIKYVSRRVEIIRMNSGPLQWNYMPLQKITPPICRHVLKVPLH